jgi:polysaccharide pyruvyl transferase WcaK-like protein
VFRPLRVVVIADLAGDERYHAGDEAMFIADMELLDDVAGRMSVTILGRHSEEAARRYGTAAHPDAGFVGCRDESSRAELFDRLDRDGSPLDELMARTDLVLLAGGGNLCSSWPEHIYERALLASRARAAGVPVALLGQTIGPHLDGSHRRLVADTVLGARLVGVRELDSAVLVEGLGERTGRLLRQADDALFLKGTRPRLPVGFDVGRPWVAVTVHPFAAPDDDVVAALARRIARWATERDLQMMFVPHCRAPEGPGGASDVDIAVAMGRATGGFVLAPPEVPVPDARGVAWAARNASMVVSSRYHPVVFATSAGVPALGLPCDAYTRTKIVGALRHAGRETHWMDLASYAAGDDAGIMDRVMTAASESGMASEETIARVRRLDRRRRIAVAELVEAL